MSDIKVVGLGPIRFPWERKWDEEADALAERELRIAYGAAGIPVPPEALSIRGDQDSEVTNSLVVQNGEPRSDSQAYLEGDESSQGEDLAVLTGPAALIVADVLKAITARGVTPAEADTIPRGLEYALARRRAADARDNPDVHDDVRDQESPSEDRPLAGYAAVIVDEVLETLEAGDVTEEEVVAIIRGIEHVLTSPQIEPGLAGYAAEVVGEVLEALVAGGIAPESAAAIPRGIKYGLTIGRASKTRGEPNDELNSPQESHTELRRSSS